MWDGVDRATGSVVVGRPPQIAVLTQAVFGWGIEKRVSPGGLEQPLDIARGGDPGGQRAFAGEFKPGLAVSAGEPQHAETSAHALLGMLARTEQPVDIVPMAGPRAAALVRSLSGVRLAIARCAGGMCSLAVVWCALAALRGWLATRSPLWKIATAVAVSGKQRGRVTRLLG